MPYNVTKQLIAEHLLSGHMQPGEEIGIRIDQTLLQDATGTLVMLELEAMGCTKVKTDISVQYVDHNILQTDFKNADDHLFLQSACNRFGIWFSRPGNGVSHPVHMERFGIPKKTLLGSDSHTCAAGALGMLAIGIGGLEVALAMMGEPFYFDMPIIMGVHLTGQLPDWVSAKDIILEMLRRRGVDGGLGKIFEYHGPGLKQLTAMDRHVIANMGAELGATASVFPSDEVALQFLEQQGRKEQWAELLPEQGATYEEHEEIDLSKLEPLIALPSSPGNVKPVREVAGKEIYQSMIGSSANPGLRDFAVPALMVRKKQIHPRVSLDINPTSRQILENLVQMGFLQDLIQAGARIHQAGCNGCIGMGQAPATDRASLRTVPRNFPGRSGTKNDQVYLCSPEVATASALTGVITDPRTLKMEYPKFQEPKKLLLDQTMVLPPESATQRQELLMGPNIKPLPALASLPDAFSAPVLLKMGDDVSTDEILPAGSNVLPFRSNIPAIAKFAFSQIDETFYNRALPLQQSGFVVVAGSNYGQGSSREHAALAPRYLGLQAVIARSFARIHRDNLINFGIVPMIFGHGDDLSQIEQGDVLSIEQLQQAVASESGANIQNHTQRNSIRVVLELTKRERHILLAGGRINQIKLDKSDT